ncbi:MAG TPA: ATP synthase F0 subunit B [Polyangia bacterium]|jgi:F-type H+-transporting ATPase subunit b|nr:ATP synthase F0 subunit B [Polyangia bacterium]
MFPTLLAAAPQVHQPQLIDVDGTVFVQLGVFLALVLVLYRFLWKPYLRVRSERVSRIDGYRDEAARLQADADARLARLEAELAEARRVGAGERAVARAEALAREHTLMAEAQALAQKTLADARAQLEATVAAERAKLQQKAAELGRDAAKKILGREVAS